jgi:hypothetical protein
MDHATEEIPDEADDATSRRHPPAQDPARPAPQRGASLLLIRSRMQTVVLAYLLDPVLSPRRDCHTGSARSCRPQRMRETIKALIV